MPRSFAANTLHGAELPLGGGGGGGGVPPDTLTTIVTFDRRSLTPIAVVPTASPRSVSVVVAKVVLTTTGAGFAILMRPLALVIWTCACEPAVSATEVAETVRVESAAI